MPRRASFGHGLVLKDTPLSEQTVGLNEGARLSDPIPRGLSGSGKPGPLL